MKNIILLGLLLFTSCTKFLQVADEDYYDQVDIKGHNGPLKILFSNNINGETHPCGCRHHPLGGLPQVAGIFHQAAKDASVIYVDTGDTFFASTTIPDPIRKSSEHTAEALAQALAKLNITFFVPGDQDFALGESYLAKLIKDNKLPVVVSNFGQTEIEHKKWGHIKFGDQNLFFLGVIDPAVFFSIKAPDLLLPETALQSVLTEIEKKYPNLPNKKFILLSHSGMDTDKILAKKFPQFSWVIGSHTQSFTNHPIEEGKTKLVQVLSRNHYIGEIAISKEASKQAEFKLHESSDEKKDLIPNNPWNSWLTKFKSELEAIQAKEQGFFETDHSGDKFKTYASCMECHEAQGQFWQKTAHAIAYQTLAQAKSQHNPNCIGCHTLGHNNPKGFASSHTVVQFDEAQMQPAHEKKYFARLETIMHDLKSVRETDPKIRMQKSNEWIKLDKEFAVTHNFANVQCLNCHSQADDHPFDVGDKKKFSMQDACVKCHTSDQSPEWYDKDDKGVATTLNKTYFAKMLKQVACPAN